MTAAFVNDLVSELRPGVTVESADILVSRAMGMRTTPHRCRHPRRSGSQYVMGVPVPRGLPDTLLAKISFPEDMGSSNPILDAEFENEVLFLRAAEAGTRDRNAARARRAI
jgi:hypothetical protein